MILRRLPQAEVISQTVLSHKEKLNNVAIGGHFAR